MSKEPFFASATARSTTDEAADADSDDSLTFVDTILAPEAPGCDFDCFVLVKALGA